METNIDEDILERRLHPHHATITLKIDVRKMNKDGTFDHYVMGNSLLAKYGITTKAQICVSGTTEADCIKIVKEKLEKLNG
tara:strand:+ start:355 stop:597 length:243 start_codon:yes stop_codon:yes gene_type:complete